MSGMIKALNARGYAVIAPDGTPREGRSGRGWSFHPFFPKARDEIAFLQDVKADAAERFGFSADSVVLSGFSIGGSMTAYAACDVPDGFAAYAPVGGGLWRPHPTECAGPVKMFHTHGWSDGTVPLEGRILRGEGRDDPDGLVQGDVFETLQIWRVANGCARNKPAAFETEGRYWRRSWSCSEGAALELAMHPGGHSVPRGWADMMLDWFEEFNTPN
jgi:polyhydroxybutyrate depolymerase